MNEKYTLITGGSEGIGLEMAKLFAKSGDNLFLIARNEERLIKVKNELMDRYNIKIEILAIDFFIDSSCEKLYDFVDKNLMIVDKIINCAAIGSFGDFVDAEEGFEEKIITLNINTVTNITKHFLNIMKERRSGMILNVSSTAAFVAGPRMSMYYATKAYVLSLSEALHEEAKEYGVYVGCLCPGPCRTQFQEKAKIQKAESAKKFLMEPEEVASIAYKGFIKKKAIIIPGFKNKILIFGNKLIPRSISRRIILKNNK